MQNTNKIDVFLYSTKSNAFASDDDTKLRRFYKNALELNDIRYITNNIDDRIKIVHFVNLDDYKKFNSFKNKKFLKIVNVFVTEKDKGRRLLIRTKNKETKEFENHISKKDVDVLNEFDLIIAPTLTSKEFLIKEGVTSKIELLNPPVKLTKVDLKSSEISNIAYIYFHLEENTKFFMILLDHHDEEAASRCIELANKYKDIRFLIFTGDLNDKKSKAVKKIFKRHPSNILLASNVAEDIYYSALYRCDGVILLNEIPLYALEIMETLASKKPLLTLESSIIPDMIIDKINGHVYNNFDSLIQGIDDLNQNKLLDLKESGYEFASKNKIQAIGMKLVEIYRKLLKENEE